VTTISGVHPAICTDAIKAGKHVICEKTLAETEEDSLAIVKAAEASNKNFYTSYMKRFIPAVELAKELMPSIGRVVNAHVRAYQGWGDRWKNPPTTSWFYTPPGGTSGIVKRYGGGILVCGGSHMLDMSNFLFGLPRRLHGTRFVPEGKDYDIHAGALMETDDGAPIHFETWAHALGKTVGFLHDGWDEVIEINGEYGRLVILSASWDNVDDKSSVLVHHDGKTGRTTTHNFPCVSPFDRAMAFFCDNIRKGTQGTQSKSTGYEVDKLISTIKQSAASGKAINLTW
jgi:predicted dehydrogenase